MIESRTVRAIVLGTMVTAMVVITAFTAKLVWPHWREYRAVTALNRAIRNKDQQATEEAMNKVHELHAGWTAVPALGELLKEDDEEVRRIALNILSFIVSSTKPEDQFKTIEGNPNGPVKLMPWADIAIPLYISAMKDEVPWIRWQATEHLGSCAEFGLDVKQSIPSLTHLLADDDCRVRAAAAAVLGKIGPDAKDSIAALTELLHDNSTYTWKDVRGPQGTVSVSKEAAIALKRIDPKPAANGDDDR